MIKFQRDKHRYSALSFRTASAVRNLLCGGGKSGFLTPSRRALRACERIRNDKKLFFRVRHAFCEMSRDSVTKGA
jgi:hypothetical protein